MDKNKNSFNIFSFDPNLEAINPVYPNDSSIDKEEKEERKVEKIS